MGLLPWRPRLAAAGSTTHVFDPVSSWNGGGIGREREQAKEENQKKLIFDASRKTKHTKKNSKRASS